MNLCDFFFFFEEPMTKIQLMIKCFMDSRDHFLVKLRINLHILHLYFRDSNDIIIIIYKSSALLIDDMWLT